MEFRHLDVTLISAKDLKDVNVFSKMDVYAVASISNDPRTRQKTPVDKDAGTHPKWNFPMKFTLDESSLQSNRLFLVVRLVSDRHLGDREIGEVHIPIKELFDNNNNGEGKSGRTESYAVRLPSGKTKGTLEFSYGFGEKYKVEAPTPAPAPPQPPQTRKAGEEPVMAYPAATGYGASSSAYQGYPPPPPQHGYGYPPPPQGYGYPTPPPQGYGYPPPPQGYGYGYPPPQGYGYPGQKPPKKSGGNMGLGIAGGLLGGLLIGDMISDVSDAGAYDAGFGDGMDF